MKFRRTNIMVIAIFALLVFVPLFCSNREKDAVSEIDNKALAKDPMTAMEGGERFADAVDNYIDDRIGFRQELIKLNSLLNYFVFHISPTQEVILGLDGWLFYNNEGIIEQYTGEKRYTEDELKKIAGNLKNAQEYLRQRNCEFVLFLAPNKERVYSDYMPLDYQEARISEECSTEQLIQYLKENTDIHVVWPFDEIQQYRKDHPAQPTYYHLDTHWNLLGGYIGTKVLLGELGISIPDPDELNMTETGSDSCDLFKMMALEPWLQMDDTDYRVDGFPREGMQFEDGGFYGRRVTRNEGTDKRRLLMVRDSFASKMLNYIGSCFDFADLVHVKSFSRNLIDEEKPDIFVYELVERNTDVLLAPVVK